MRERARKTFPFVTGVLAALLALFLYNSFFPGAKPLTQTEVNAAISSAMASATPRPADAVLPKNVRWQEAAKRELVARW